MTPRSTHKEKPAAATIRDRLNLVLSTTHLLTKEQTNDLYHNLARARKRR